MSQEYRASTCRENGGLAPPQPFLPLTHSSLICLTGRFAHIRFQHGSRSDVNIRAFVAVLQVRNEVWSATVTLGNTNDRRGVHLATFGVVVAAAVVPQSAAKCLGTSPVGWRPRPSEKDVATVAHHLSTDLDELLLEAALRAPHSSRGKPLGRPQPLSRVSTYCGTCLRLVAIANLRAVLVR
jgi:hypothetical protein